MIFSALTPSLIVSFLIAVLPEAAAAQESKRNWEDAQRLKPARIGSVERIAPATEPGTPFIVRGTVQDIAGKLAAGIEVFAYQTDSSGIYAKPGATDPWRLKGWAVTDAQGRFEFRTVRPGSYPADSVPAHIHLILSTTCCGHQENELMFEDDPLVTREYRNRPRAIDIKLYGKVERRANGSQEVAYTIRLRPRGNF